MEVSPTQKPARIYKLYRLLVVPAILWYLWNMQYLFTASAGETVIYAMWGRYFIFFAAIPLCIVLGIAIMRVRPGNVIGPALIVYTAGVSSEAIFDLAIPATQAHLNLLALWLFLWTSNAVITGHFPSGKIYPRWGAIMIYGLVIVSVLNGFIVFFGAPTSYGASYVTEGVTAQPNPFFVESLEPFEAAGLQDLLLNSIVPLLLLFTIIRYIRTTKLERKQMRWLFVGALIGPLAISVQFTANITDEVTFTATLGIIVGLLSVPIAIAIGVLFYRLWDIDVIIRRTLIYAVVSALLALTYFAIVLTTQTLLSGFIPDDNTLLIVGSTLAVAALFNPVLQRVQNVIDRLFYRKRYDAEATLDQFSEKIRDAMDTNAIEQHILDTVTNTIQPESISLWVVDTKQLQAVEETR